MYMWFINSNNFRFTKRVLVIHVHVINLNDTSLSTLCSTYSLEQFPENLSVITAYFSPQVTDC